MKMSFTKLIAFAFFLSVLSIGTASAQCFGTSQYPSGTITVGMANTTPVTITTCNFAGEYALLNVTDPGVYNFTSSFPDFLTLTDGLNNVIASGFGPLVGVIPSAGTYRIHFHLDPSCGTDFNCRTTTVAYLSALGGCLPPTGVTITGISSSGATANWNAATPTPVNYEYIVTTVGTTPSSTASGTITTATTALLTGLNPATTYYFFIRISCGTDSSVWVSANFLTSCVSVTDFVQNFDLTAPNVLPPCFQKVGANGFAYVLNGPNLSPMNSLYLWSFGTGNEAVVALPEVSNINSGTHRLLFYARNWFGNNTPIEVGYVTNVNDPLSFISLQTLTISSSTTFGLYIANLGTTPPTGSRLAIRHPGIMTNEVLIDNMVWELIPPCPYPFGISATPASPTSATITWVPGGNETQWEVVVLPAGSPAPTGAGTSTLTTSYLQTGLTTGASYDVYVRSICGALTSTWQFFNFSLVPCPSGATSTADTKIASVSVSGTIVSSPVGPGNCATYTDYTSLPPFQMAYGLASPIEIFYGTCGGVFGAYAKVYVDMNNDLVFDPITEVVAEGAVTAAVPLITTANMPTVPQYQGIVRMRVVLVEGGSTTTVMPCGTYTWGETQDFLVNLGAPPSCLPPTNVNFTAVTNNSYTVNWTAGNTTQAAFIIEHGPAGFTPGTGTVDYSFFTPSYTVSNLTQQTNYQVYITELCSVTDSSFTIGPFTVTTSQVPVSTFPYFQGWESGNANWALSNGTQINQWHIGTATSFAGTSSAYISDNTGVSNTYNSLGFVGSVTHMYRDFQLPMGSAVIDLSFAWKCVGEGFWDYLRVWVVPVTFTPTVGTQITPTGTAPTGRIQLGTNFNQQAAWTTQNFTLPTSYEGQSFRLVFEWRNDGSGDIQPPIAIDNINVVLSNCPAPTALSSVISLTSTNTTLSWTSNAPLFNLEIGTAGFVPTGIPTSTGVTSPYVATGFTAGQPYQFYVQANCGTEVSAWSGPHTFIPGVGVVTTYPPLTGGNGSGGITFEVVSNQNVYVTGIENVFSSNGTVSVWVRPGGVIHTGATAPEISTSTGWIQLLNAAPITYQFNVPVLIPGQYEFLLPANTPYGVFIEANVSYQTYVNPPSDFTDGILTVKTGPGFGFGGIGPFPAFSPRQFLGSVLYTTPPACLPPFQFTAANVTTTSASLSWTPGSAGATTWQISYGPTGTAPGAGTSIITTNNPYALSGLTAGTNYQLYIREVCPNGIDSSSWAGPLNMSTLVCDVANQCAFTADLTDSWGDGWNGAILGIRQNGVMVTTFGPAFTTGTAFNGVAVSVCDGVPAELVVVELGSFPTEVGMTLFDQSGASLYIHTSPPGISTVGQVLYTFTPNCGTIVNQICDNFDAYTTGNLSTQSPLWNSWAGGTDFTVVSNEQFRSAPHSMKSYDVTATQESDIVLELGDLSAGVHELDFWFFVPATNGGYFNLMHQYAPATSGYLWAMETYLNGTNGTGTVQWGSIGTGTIGTFNFNPGAWNRCRIVVDLNTNQASMRVNNQTQITWVWNNNSTNPLANRLAAMNVYSAAPTGLQPVLYIDDLCFGPYSPPCVVSTQPTGTSVSFCQGTPATLTATAGDPQNYVVWTNGQSQIVGEGNSYETDTLYATTTFGALDATFISAEQTVGPLTNIAPQGFGNFTNGVYVTVESPIYIDSMLVKSDGALVMAVNVWNHDQTQLIRTSDSVTISGAGDHRIAVGMTVAPGQYFFNVEFISGAGQLFRATDGASFPYAIQDVMSIDSINFVNQLRYYYLFEWVVREVCLGGVATNITANPIPAQANGTGNQVSASATEAIWQFNGSGSLGATSYSWNFGDGSTGTGASPTHTYTANGQYTVELTIQTQCGPRSSTFQITVQGISVEENGLAEMSVYPNPTRDQVVIAFESGTTQDIRLELVNALGQTIWTENVQNHSGAYRKELSLGTYAKGIYHLRIHTAKGTHTERISLQ